MSPALLALPFLSVCFPLSPRLSLWPALRHCLRAGMGVGSRTVWGRPPAKVARGPPRPPPALLVLGRSRPPQTCPTGPSHGEGQAVWAKVQTRGHQRCGNVGAGISRKPCSWTRPSLSLESREVSSTVVGGGWVVSYLSHQGQVPVLGKSFPGDNCPLFSP